MTMRREFFLEKIVGVIDEPVAITIGIQGEWGSGKTSLINSIYHEFENSPQYKQIWINSWEYSLLYTLTSVRLVI